MSRQPLPYSTRVRQRKIGQSHLSVYTGSVWRWQDWVFTLLLIGMALTLLAWLATWAGVLSLSHHKARVTRPAAAISALRVTGLQWGSSFEVDHLVQLSWRGLPGSRRYRVEVATAPSVAHLSDTAIFRPPHRSFVTVRAVQRVRVTRLGTYYWRVQALIHGRWGAFTSAGRFFVVPPFLARPSLLSPSDGAYLARSARLCWAKVARAGRYRLWFSRHVPMTVTGLCHRVFLPAGSYDWKVAAVHHGSRTYVGPFSAPARFIIHAPVVSAVTRRSVPPPAVAAPAPVVAAAPAATSKPVHQVVRRPQPVRVAHPTVRAPVVQPAPTAIVQLPPPVSAGNCIPMYTC